MYKNKQRQTSIIINHKLIQKVQKESVYLETLPSPFKKNIKGKIFKNLSLNLIQK
jgi:hypothetical protein